MSSQSTQPRHASASCLSGRVLRAAVVCTTALVMNLATTPAIAQKAHVSTSMGDIVIQLDGEKAPKTVKNFIGYAKAGHYDGTIFHRVIENFMVQGGGMTAEMREKATRPPIALESRNGLSNLRGTVAMARTAVPDSATAQFFINVQDNTFLDQSNARDGEGYAVFGKVTSGMDVVDRMRAVATATTGGHSNVPRQAIVIKRVTVESEK